MADPVEKDIKTQEVMEAVGELRKQVEKSIPDLEIVKRCNDLLDKQEDANQKNLQAANDAETKAAEIKERLDAMEIELARAGGPGDGKDYHDSPEYKALHQVITVGKGEITPEEKALLRTDSDTSGGYLTTTEMDSMIVKAITEISRIRTIARVRSIGAKSLTVPVRGGILSSTYEGEAAKNKESVSDYKSETLNTYRQTVTIPITMDMLMNSAFDMETEIFGDAMEAFAQNEGQHFVTGDGVKKPKGFLADTRVGFRTTTTSGTIDASDVILLTGDLKVGYNPSYVMSRTTLAFLRTLKSTTGSFLWSPGMDGPAMNSINGFSYILAQDMPAIAAGSLSIAFGDFQRGYLITDRTGITTIRDEVTAATEGIVKFTIHRWNNGQVILPEAIRTLKTKA